MAQSKGKGKTPLPTFDEKKYNLEELKKDVRPDIEKAIAATKASQLSQYVAFVTGGANGLGREIVKAFVKEGTKVAILDKDTAKGNELASDLCRTNGKSAAMYFNCNLTDPKSFESSIKLAKTQLGRFDILVNNASCWADGIENFDKSITLNFKTVVTGSLLAVDYMGAKKGGNGGLVVNVADTLAFKPAFLTPIYAATKAAVVKFTTDMGLPQHVKMSKVGFLAVVPNAFKGSRLFEEPHNKVLIPGREMTEEFRHSFTMNSVKQTTEQVARNVIGVIKTGEKTGIFLIEDGEDFKKVEMPSVPLKIWLPE